jgi:hypothetical protein
MKTYTITGKTDGFGAQYQAIMSGIAYCEYYNYKYIHTPFKYMEHVKYMKEIDNLNKFIGIPVSNDNNKNIDIYEEFSEEVHYSENPDIYYTDNVLNKIRNYYFSVKKPEVLNNDIVIHIRRGDVTSKTNNERYINDNSYIRVIHMLKKMYPNYRICIFSQGKISDFKKLFLEGVYFDLNNTIENTFHLMVTAKVLVTSISSFSYCAALLNENTIYYIPFWSYPLKRWNVLT